MLATLLAIVGLLLIIFGVVTLVRGGILWGIVLIVVGIIVAPGGYWFG